MTKKTAIKSLRNIFLNINPTDCRNTKKIDNTSDDSDNNSHSSTNNYTIKRKKKNSKEQNQTQEQTHQTSQISIRQSAFLLDNDENDVYVDTHYKHYKTTKRRSNKGVQIRILRQQMKNHQYRKAE